jgi:hypothetical protein
MPKSTDSCNRILNLMYSATAWPTVADNAAATPLTNVYVGLHTSTSLTAATNSQAENEVAYTNYARVARARSTGFTAASGGSLSNAALLQFPQSGATGATLQGVSTGVATSGATAVWHYGALNSPITIGAAASITPQFLANGWVITET